MGYLLYREVRDALPADCTPTERLVAWAIADDANDKTRRSWIKMPELMQRTGIKTESGVRKVLQRLAARGWEFRVPITTGKDGRAVFAARGHSLDYTVPKGGPGGSPYWLATSGDDSGSQSVKGNVITDAKGGPTESPNGRKAARPGLKGGPLGPPLSSTPLLSPVREPAYGRTPHGSDLDGPPAQKIGGQVPRGAQPYRSVANDDDEHELATVTAIDAHRTPPDPEIFGAEYDDPDSPWAAIVMGEHYEYTTGTYSESRCSA